MATIKKETTSLSKEARAYEKTIMIGRVVAVVLFFMYLYFVSSLSLLLSMFMVKKAFPVWSRAQGEARVFAKLDELPDTYHVFNDILVPTSCGEKTTQLDHVVIGPPGVFVVETKNHTGAIYGGYKKQWSQVLTTSKGYKRSYKFYSPVSQNQGHIHALKAYFADTGLDCPYIHCIVCFTDRNVELKVAGSKQVDVIQLSGLLGKLLDKDVELDSQEIERMSEVVERLTTESSGTP